MGHIHWYPGHIAKAEKKLKEQVNLVDMVIEVIDARIPKSSVYPDLKSLIGEKPRLILMNKSDLCKMSEVEIWSKKISAETNCPVIITSISNQKDMTKIINKILELSQPAMAKHLSRGLLPRAARAMVIGMPNVGKSSIINKIIKKSKTKTGAKSGVTRQQQWVRIHPRVDLLDTPGIIPVKQTNQITALKLAFVNSIGENAYEVEDVAKEFIKITEDFYPNLLKEHYNLKEDHELSIENIALARNWIVKNSMPDITRTAQNILSDFREGRLGKLILDEMEQ